MRCLQCTFNCRISVRCVRTAQIMPFIIPFQTSYDDLLLTKFRIGSQMHLVLNLEEESVIFSSRHIELRGGPV